MPVGFYDVLNLSAETELVWAGPGFRLEKKQWNPPLHLNICHVSYISGPSCHPFQLCCLNLLSALPSSPPLLLLFSPTLSVHPCSLGSVLQWRPLNFSLHIWSLLFKNSFPTVCLGAVCAVRSQRSVVLKVTMTQWESLFFHPDEPWHTVTVCPSE